MDRITIAAIAAPERRATVDGLLELAISARPDATIDLLWFTEWPAGALAADAIAVDAADGRLDRTKLDALRVPWLLIDGDRAANAKRAVIDVALFQNAYECPTRTLERIVLLPHAARGFTELPGAALAALAARWQLELIADRPEQRDVVPAGLSCRVLPPGRRRDDAVRRADLVIAQDLATARLANAMLRPAILLGAPAATNGDWPFLWPSDAEGLVARIESYDAESGGPLLLNWKRGAEAIARAAIDEWLPAPKR